MTGQGTLAPAAAVHQMGAGMDEAAERLSWALSVQLAAEHLLEASPLGADLALSALAAAARHYRRASGARCAQRRMLALQHSLH